MTTEEQYIELGKMIEERAETRRRLACVKNKLSRFRTILGQAQSAIDGYTSWETTGETLIVQPHQRVAGGGEVNGVFPSPEDLARALKDRDSLQKKLEDLETRLNEAGC